MKKNYLLTFLLILCVEFCFAQNTFTNSGANVGIGTTNPLSALQVLRGGTNSGSDYPSINITTNGTGNIFGPILYLNGQSGTNGRMWGLVSSGALDAPATGAAGNFAIYDTQGGSRLVITNTGNVGVGALSPSSYFHGGNNKVIEIYNANTSANSQAHLILSTASLVSNASAGSVTWISKSSSGTQGLAWIGALTQGDVSNNASGNLIFGTADNYYPLERMRISSVGNLLIGQTSQTNTAYKLDVNGSARFNAVVVNSSGADFVFKKDYHLNSLKNVQKYIATNHHLPEIASAEEMQNKGMDIGEMNKKLLQKVEELTLYLIENDRRNKENKIQIKKQQAQISEFKKRLDTFGRNTHAQ